MSKTFLEALTNVGKNLKSRVDELNGDIINLSGSLSITSENGYYVNGTDGHKYARDGYNCNTVNIDKYVGYSISVDTITAHDGGYSFCDSDNNILSYGGVNLEQKLHHFVLDVPENAKYLMFTSTSGEPRVNISNLTKAISDLSDKNKSVQSGLINQGIGLAYLVNNDIICEKTELPCFRVVQNDEVTCSYTYVTSVSAVLFDVDDFKTVRLYNPSCIGNTSNKRISYAFATDKALSNCIEIGYYANGSVIDNIYSVPEGAKYLITTTSKGKEGDVVCSGTKLNVSESYKTKIIDIPKIEIGALINGGYYKINDDSFVEIDSRKSTQKIKVIPKKKIRIYYAAFSMTTEGLCCYDIFGNFIKGYNYDDIGIAKDTQVFDYIVPSDTYYIRLAINMNNNYNPLFDVAYVDEVTSFDSYESAELKDLQSKMGLLLPNFLKSADKPILTWIDDDAIPLGVCRVKYISSTIDNPIIDGNDTVFGIDNVTLNTGGIKATFAVRTDSLETYKSGSSAWVTVRNEGLSDYSVEDDIIKTLLSYQSEGYHIANHTYSHGGMWNDGASAYNVKECESDAIKAICDLNKAGFIDTNYLVYPFGTATVGTKSIAKKWFESGIRSNYGDGINHLTSVSRLDVNRRFIKLNALTDNNKIVSDELLSYYKWIIDSAYENGDWIVFGTHAYSSSEYDENLIRRVIRYAIYKGFDVQTLNQAFKNRKMLFDLHDMFN